MAEGANTVESVNTVDDAPFTAFHWRVAIFGAGGWFVDGYVLTSIAVALEQIAPQFGLGGTETGLIGASALVGILFGALLGGPISDRIGRRRLLTLDLVLFVVASVLQLFVGSFLPLLILRFILGLAIGVDYAVCSPYMAELTPRRQRGPVLAAPPTIWFVGAAVAYAVTAGIAGLGEESWRWMLASSAVPAALVLLLRIGVPESPRWLMTRGRVEEARAVVRSVFGENARVEDIAEDDEGNGGIRTLLEGGYLKRTVFVGLLWLLQISPVFAIYTFAPTVLRALGLGGGYVGSIVLSLLFVVGAIPVIFFLINGWGRRPVAIAGFVAATISFVILSFTGIPAWLVAASFVFYALFMGGAQTLEGIYPGELFPTEVRGTAAGIAAAMSRIGSAISTFLLPVMLESLGISTVMIGLAVLSALGVWLCLAWAPETRGKTLREASGLAVATMSSGVRANQIHDR
jgi:MFS transporter, putative metabolite transport protein